MRFPLTGIPYSRCHAPGPAVFPPTADRAWLKKVATVVSVAVGGRPPTYTLRACRVACWEGGWAEAREGTAGKGQKKLSLGAAKTEEHRHHHHTTGKASHQHDQREARKPCSHEHPRPRSHARTHLSAH